MDETPVNIRWERVQRLLDELRYEITRGMMEGDLDESLGLRWYVPTSKAIPDGVVFCEFRTRPILRYAISPGSFTALRAQVIEECARVADKHAEEMGTLYFPYPIA